MLRVLVVHEGPSLTLCQRRKRSPVSLGDLAQGLTRKRATVQGIVHRVTHTALPSCGGNGRSVVLYCVGVSTRRLVYR